MNLTSLARPLIEIGRRLSAAGIMSGSEGNLSLRLSDSARTDDGELVRAGTWLITSRGAHPQALTPADFSLLSSRDESLAGPEPAWEWRLHGAIYETRDDVFAIVHAHPPYATALALAGVVLPADTLPELLIELREIPLLPFAAPGAGAMLEAVQRHLGTANGALLAQHGALTVGDTPGRAAARLENLERAAMTYTFARLLLGTPPRSLTREQAAAVLEAAGRQAT